MLLLLLLLLFLPTANASWVDPDTPLEAATTTAIGTMDDTVYRLVFSDEFNVAHRTFEDGADPRWTALNKNDETNNPLHYYSHDQIITDASGVLNITTQLDPRNFSNNNETKEIASGMLQSWNKFCFTGGIVEFSAKLPGTPSTAGGLWPAVWMMGNLARATYVDSSERLWPFSSNVCDDRTRYSQLLNSCPDDEGDNWKYDDLPNDRGRGAPEIDLLEILTMTPLLERSILSVSLQVAPGVREPRRPQTGHAPNSVSGRCKVQWLVSRGIPVN